MRTIAACYVGVLTVLNGPAVAGAQDVCRARDLGTLGGDIAYANGINERGQIVGSSSLTERSLDADPWELPIAHAFVWQRGRMRDLGALSEDTSSVASAINDSGVIVGQARIDSEHSVPVVWQEGVIARLAFDDDGGGGFAIDINNRGQIIGSANGRALLWEDAASDPIELCPGRSCALSAINDAGVIAGTTNPGDFGERAAIWRDGVMTVVDSLERAPDEDLRSGLSAINNAGLTIGSISRAEGVYDVYAPFLWSRGRGARAPELEDAKLSSINDRGVVAVVQDTDLLSLWRFDSGVRTQQLGRLPGLFDRHIHMNNRYQIAWTAGQRAYTCRLPWRTALRGAAN